MSTFQYADIPCSSIFCAALQACSLRGNRPNEAREQQGREFHIVFIGVCQTCAAGVFHSSVTQRHTSALGLNERLSDTRVNINFKELLLRPQIPILMGKKNQFGLCFCSSLGFQEVAEKNTRTQQRDL